MTLNDGDGNNANFSNADTMQRLVLSCIGGTLSFPEGNQAVISQFAIDHSKEIIDIPFPSGIAANTIGRSEHQLSASLTFDEVVAPVKNPRGSRRKQFRNELSGRLQYGNLELNNSNGYSVGTLLGYRRDIADRFEFGRLIPYRFTSLNDPSDTTAHFAQFDLFGTFPPTTRRRSLSRSGPTPSHLCSFPNRIPSISSGI